MNLIEHIKTIFRQYFLLEFFVFYEFYVFFQKIENWQSQVPDQWPVVLQRGDVALLVVDENDGHVRLRFVALGEGVFLLLNNKVTFF